MTFQELLAQYEIPIAPESHHHRRAGWEQIDCPACNSEGHWRLGFHLEFQYFVCWNCGKLPRYETLTAIFKEPYHRLRELLNDLDSTQTQRIVERGGFKEPKGVGNLLPAHCRYLTGRGFDPDTLNKQWAIKGIGISGRLSWRVWIPITLSGIMVSWTTRDIGDSGPRYLSAQPHEESVGHKEILYGEDFVEHTIIVVEGPLDVWAIGPGAAATLGIAWTQSQMRRIAKYPRRYICFDAEENAQRQAKKLCRQLEVYEGETTNLVLESGKDSSRASGKEIKELKQLLR
jgi:hypothetical protein